ncbi:MAG: adenylate kinase [Elusimicrobia bacterium]|nr:adenylate kinase [Elusimicrobiota bacterium]
MNIVFLGPPGSGKGTQAKGLAEKHKLVHLSTGDLFRDAIARKTPLGLEIKSYVDGGQLVPDELVSRVVFDKLNGLGKSQGFLLDGYPRTLDQAKALQNFASTAGIPIDAVLFFDVAFDELIKRLSARRQCGSCKEVYNLVNKPPKKAGICDKCASPLTHRPDDQPAVVEERLQVYKRQTEPLLDFYRAMPMFRRVDGAKDIASVGRQIDAALQELPAKSGRK